ncbi:MAG: bifunctional nuclease domain-containing protein [Fodinibius sp.]|nr:bifunctional nuclease domain-containing protein [Fodinibius sp.]
MEQDARPSDAIALAVRFDASIFVDAEVLEEAGIISEGDEPTDLASTSESQDQPKELTKLEKLENELQTAIDTENYEKASPT